MLGVLSISFWAYCSTFYNHDRTLPLYDNNRYLKYPSGYVAIGIFQWILIGINLVWIFNWPGLLVFILIFVCGSVISTGYHKWLNINANSMLAMFGVTFWLLVVATVIKVLL